MATAQRLIVVCEFRLGDYLVFRSAARRFSVGQVVNRLLTCFGCARDARPRYVGQLGKLFPMSAGRTEGGDENWRYLTGSLCWELRTGTRGRRRSGDVEADKLL